MLSAAPAILSACGRGEPESAIPITVPVDLILSNPTERYRAVFVDVALRNQDDGVITSKARVEMNVRPLDVLRYPDLLTGTPAHRVDVDALDVTDESATAGHGFSVDLSERRMQCTVTVGELADGALSLNTSCEDRN